MSENSKLKAKKRKLIWLTNLKVQWGIGDIFQSAQCESVLTNVCFIGRNVFEMCRSFKEIFWLPAHLNIEFDENTKDLNLIRHNNYSKKVTLSSIDTPPIVGFRCFL